MTSMGGVDQEEFVVPETFLRGGSVSAANEFEVESTRDVLGGHFVLETPVRGLRVEGSAYTGIEIGSARRKVFGLQAEYLIGAWSLRSEYAHETVPGDSTVNGTYVEAAYRLNERWQGVADLFLKKVTRWPGGLEASPVDQSATSAVRERFSRDMLGDSIGGVMNYWQQQIFAGRGLPPSVKAEKDVIPFVETSAGAIAYVAQETALPAGIKVLPIRD
jgi:hypothetical protein